tara:strand:+ start:338 stop:772 length:435 start_codon:yes stop_codon:yes gene_type:complete
MNDCLFCEIVEKKVNAFTIYEDRSNIAILDLFPSVRGQSLVIPKKHFGSYVFKMNDENYISLMLASRKVARLIDERLGSLRTCMVMEGMEIDHAHIKLYPIYEVSSSISLETIDLSVYRGFISTKHGKRASHSDLDKIIEQFKQ